MFSVSTIMSPSEGNAAELTTRIVASACTAANQGQAWAVQGIFRRKLAISKELHLRLARGWHQHSSEMLGLAARSWQSALHRTVPCQLHLRQARQHPASHRPDKTLPDTTALSHLLQVRKSCSGYNQTQRGFRQTRHPCCQPARALHQVGGPPSASALVVCAVQQLALWQGLADGGLAEDHGPGVLQHPAAGVSWHRLGQRPVPAHAPGVLWTSLSRVSEVPAGQAWGLRHVVCAP